MVQRVWIAISLATSVVGLPTPGAGQAEAVYAVTEVTDGGSIRGVVTFSGAAPEPVELAVNSDREVCASTPKFGEDLTVAPGTGGLQNVVVWLDNISEGKDWSEDAATPALIQVACRFDPHVVVVPVGQTLSLLNNDGILHNIHTKGSQNRPVNKAHPGFVKQLTLRFRSPEIIEVKCDVHDWMKAWIVAAAHPYYAVTDEAGGFVLEDVPPGTYQLGLWHEALGRQSRELVVARGGEVSVEMEYSMNP